MPNTDRLIQEVKAMLKMSKIDQIHLRAVMLCMSKMSKIDQNTPKGCNSMYVKDVEDGKHTHTF